MTALLTASPQPGDNSVDVCSVGALTACGPKEDNRCMTSLSVVGNPSFATRVLGTPKSRPQLGRVIHNCYPHPIHSACGAPPAAMSLFPRMHRPYDDYETSEIWIQPRVPGDELTHDRTACRAAVSERADTIQDRGHHGQMLAKSLRGTRVDPHLSTRRGHSDAPESASLLGSVRSQKAFRLCRRAGYR